MTAPRYEAEKIRAKQEGVTQRARDERAAVESEARRRRVELIRNEHTANFNRAMEEFQRIIELADRARVLEDTWVVNNQEKLEALDRARAEIEGIRDAIEGELVSVNEVRQAAEDEDAHLQARELATAVWKAAGQSRINAAREFDAASRRAGQSAVAFSVVPSGGVAGLGGEQTRGLQMSAAMNTIASAKGEAFGSALRAAGTVAVVAAGLFLLSRLRG